MYRAASHRTACLLRTSILRITRHAARDGNGKGTDGNGRREFKNNVASTYRDGAIPTARIDRMPAVRIHRPIKGSIALALIYE